MTHTTNSDNRNCVYYYNLYLLTGNDLYLLSLYNHCYNKLFTIAFLKLKNFESAKEAVINTYYIWKERIKKNRKPKLTSCCALAKEILEDLLVEAV